MRALVKCCVTAVVAASPALANPDGASRNVPTDAEIRSGQVIDDGLDIPHIRPGTQYFEIHGSMRIARALGDRRLPTDDAGMKPATEGRGTAF